MSTQTTPGNPVMYYGRRDPDRCRVYVLLGSRAKELPKRLDLWKHSPDGFEWGYGGSGPAQLALALLAHATNDSALSIQLHQRFKFDFVARFARDRWEMSCSEIRGWIEQERARP